MNDYSLPKPSLGAKITNVTQKRSAYTGQYYNPQEMQKMIVRGALKAGVNPRTALMLAHIETGGSFDPNAINSSTKASGLYQFMPANFASYNLNNGAAFNPQKNIEAGMKMIKANEVYFRSRMGRAPTAAEVYVLHQQGMGGGTKLLRSGNKLARNVVGQKAVIQNGGHKNMSSEQFASMWLDKANRVLRFY